MKGTDILVRVPPAIKVKLNQKRAEGYSLNGFINALLARELADKPTGRAKGRRASRYTSR